jgi:hypothetical protein
MNKAEFLSLAEAAVRESMTTGLVEGYLRQEAAYRSNMRSWDVSDEDIVVDSFCLVWLSGGYEGGDCWGGVARPFVANEQKPDFVVLEGFLEANFPTLTLAQYRRILPNMEQASFSTSGYYGNSTEFAVEILKFERLWDTLVGVGLAEDC